eukprot:364925-Chlamydomonas_euryale.AAC.6
MHVCGARGGSCTGGLGCRDFDAAVAELCSGAHAWSLSSCFCVGPPPPPLEPPPPGSSTPPYAYAWAGLCLCSPVCIPAFRISASQLLACLHPSSSGVAARRAYRHVAPLLPAPSTRRAPLPTASPPALLPCTCVRRAGKAMGDKRATVAEKGFNRPFKRVVIKKAGLLEGSAAAAATATDA